MERNTEESNLENETVNDNNETQTMEVHHHAHHNHGKKTWKSFFWEFFMLFLAVFCGFLAELQLEHYIENQREKKYVSHLMQDLAKDSVNLVLYINGSNRRVERIDSLLQILINNEAASRGNDLYYHARRLVRFPTYFPSDASILQLKYSGNFRLIHDANIVKQIGTYENQSRELLSVLEEWRNDNSRFLEALGTLFDGKIFYQMLDAKNNINKPINNPQLVNNKYEVINEFIMQLQFMKGGARRNYSLAEKCFKSCVDLQKELREKYKI